MSAAADMIAEVKSLVGEVEKEIKSFEKGVEDVGSAWTDLAHINLAKVHLGEILSQMRGRRENVENEQLAQMEAEEAAAAAGPTFTQEAGIRPLTEADVTGQPAPEPAPELVAAPQEPSEPAPVDPAGDLVAPPEPADPAEAPAEQPAA